MVFQTIVSSRMIAKSRGSSDRASSFPRRRESRSAINQQRFLPATSLDSRLRGKDVMVARLLPSTSLLEKTLQSSRRVKGNTGHGWGNKEPK